MGKKMLDVGFMAETGKKHSGGGVKGEEPWEGPSGERSTEGKEKASSPSDYVSPLQKPHPFSLRQCLTLVTFWGFMKNTREEGNCGGVAGKRREVRHCLTYFWGGGGNRVRRVLKKQRKKVLRHGIRVGGEEFSETDQKRGCRRLIREAVKGMYRLVHGFIL